MNNTMNFGAKLFDCPVCKKPVEGEFSAVVEVGFAPQDNLTAGIGSIDSDVSVTGLMVRHDCRPRSAQVQREFTVLNKAVTGD